MAIDQATAQAVATEARRASLRQEVARHRAAADATANVAATVAAMNASAHAALAGAATALADLDAAGTSPLDSFGFRSDLDAVLNAERTAGKAASVDFVKSNPSCSEDQAIAAWRAAVPVGLLDALGLCRFYRARLVAARVLSVDTWEAHRAWIIGAPRDQAVGQ